MTLSGVGCISELCDHIKPNKGGVLVAANSDIDDVLIAGAEDAEQEEKDEEKKTRSSSLSSRETFPQKHFHSLRNLEISHFLKIKQSFVRKDKYETCSIRNLSMLPDSY